MVQPLKFAVRVGLVWAAGLAACGLAAPAFAQQPLVEKFVLSDTIQPVTAGQLDRAIAQAINVVVYIERTAQGRRVQAVSRVTGQAGEGYALEACASA